MCVTDITVQLNYKGYQGIARQVYRHEISRLDSRAGAIAQGSCTTSTSSGTAPSSVYFGAQSTINSIIIIRSPQNSIGDYLGAYSRGFGAGCRV